MLKFYDVENNYVRFLQTHDKRIPNVSETGNSKFLCGVVLAINGVDYYAPISSNTNVYQTSYPIAGANGKIISTIRFCFMFPAPLTVLTEKNFKQIRKINNPYADLLQKEWVNCRDNEKLILNKALSVYNIGCNKEHKFNYTCCDFKLLEQVFGNYQKKFG